MRDSSLGEDPGRKIEVAQRFTVFLFDSGLFIGKGIVVRVTMFQSGRHTALRGLNMTSRGRHNLYVDLTAAGELYSNCIT